jgi:hypothetical protein
MRLTGQPLPIGALVSAQFGVPVAAATSDPSCTSWNRASPLR